MKRLGKKANSRETIEAYMALCYCSCFCDSLTEPTAIQRTLEKIATTTVEIEA